MRRLIDPHLEALAARLDGGWLRANAVTWLGLLFGLGAIVCIGRGRYLEALLLFALNRFLDGLDGALARRQGITDLGGYLDIVLDFIVYGGLAFAFALADPPRNALYAAFLLFAFMGTASSFLAFAIMAGKRGLSTERCGPKSLYYLGGLAEGTETIIFFLLCLLWPQQFPLFATVFAIICWLTTAGRVATALQMLREPK